jgi:hypothetical protein
MSASGGGALLGVPTPTAMDSRGSRNCTSGRSNPNSRHHSGTTLCDFVVLYPTPMARDHRTGDKPESKRRARGAQMGLNDMVAPGGKLNPPWDEWLMGWPPESTALPASAMAKSRSARRRRGISSEAP